MNKLEKAKAILLEENYTCVVVDNNETKTSCLSGIRPLMGFLSASKDAFKGASMADRCIGRAAAFLMIYGGVEEVYALVISEHALEILEKYHIPVQYEEKVPYIINRDHTDMCPMEKTCLDIDSPEEAYEALKNKIKQLMQRSSS